MSPQREVHLVAPCAIQRRLSLLARTAEQLLRSEDPCAFLDNLFGDLAVELGLEVYSHYRAAEDGGSIRLAAFGGVPEADTAGISCLQLGEGVCGTVARDHRRILVEDVQRSTEPWTALIRGLGLTAYVCHPLVARGRFVGTLSYVQRVLEDREAEVRGAASAREALAALAASPPDLLVSDIGMPDQDGCSLIHAVRAHDDDAVRGLPAVALTAFARAEDRACARAAGYQIHLSKPIEPAELVAALASLVDPTRPRRAA